MYDPSIQAKSDSSPSPLDATHCPYCALQCGLRLTGTREQPIIKGNVDFPVTKGHLCIKGWTASATLLHPDRLLKPLARNADGTLLPVTWNEAFDHIVQAFHSVQSTYGKDSVGVFGSGALTNEKVYLLGKFARIALGTSQIDYNGRFCMSSAAAAANKAFGVDRGLPFPLEDISQCETILLVGSNIAETMPPLMHHLTNQRKNGGRLIVVDPRTSITAQTATLHLHLTPGSDAALANGLLHILIRDGYIDQEYIHKRTEGFEPVRTLIAEYNPELVAHITGVPIASLVKTAHLLGTSSSTMLLTGRGSEQQHQGVNNTLAYINLALALGLVGRPFSGYGSITGQGNGQGGREHGQKADQFPGYRKVDDPASRRHIASVWNVSENELPGVGRSAYEMIDTCGTEGGVRALFVMGSNIVVSAPHAIHVQDRLNALDFLVVVDSFLSETAQLADVVLPTAQWAEEEGTMTNLEGRVILRKKVFAPPPHVLTDLEILCNLASRLNKGKYFPFNNPSEVFDELRRASAGGIADYSGISYEKIIANQGIFWPCPTEDHPGTPRLFAHTFPTDSGKARFHVIQHQPPAEEIDDEYPLYLTTGRILAHYQSGTQTRRVAKLLALAPHPYVELHPNTLKRFGLDGAERVALTTRRGTAIFATKETSGIREDTVFVPFHWGDIQSVNLLTNPALDPMSKMPEFKLCAVRIDRVQPTEHILEANSHQ